MISSDRNSFLNGSSVQSRFADYGKLCEELHIIVFTPSGYNKLTISDNVFLYPTNSFSKWFYIIDAIFLAKSLPRPDLITTQDPFEAGLTGFIVSIFSGAKLHLQIHTDFLSPYFSKLNVSNKIRILISRFLLPKADSVRVVSLRIKDSLIKSGIKLKKLPFVLPIFTDAKKLMETTPKFDLHKKYPQFDFIILSVARLVEEKDISLSLKLLKKINIEFPNVGLVLVGGGEEDRFRKEAKKLGINKNVIFDGMQSDVVSYYKTADLYLCTSFYEGYGLSLIESALCGCPILATSVGEAGYALKNGHSALICDSRDVSCLFAEFSKILLDKELRKVLARNARAEILTLIPENKEAYLRDYLKAWQ